MSCHKVYIFLSALFGILSTKYRLDCIYSLTTDRRVRINRISEQRRDKCVFCTSVMLQIELCQKFMTSFCGYMTSVVNYQKLTKKYFPQFLVSFDCKTWKLKNQFLSSITDVEPWCWQSVQRCLQFDRFFSALVCSGERACTNSVKNSLRKTRFVIFKAYSNQNCALK